MGTYCCQFKVKVKLRTTVSEAGCLASDPSLGPNFVGCSGYMTSGRTQYRTPPPSVPSLLSSCSLQHKWFYMRLPRNSHFFWLHYSGLSAANLRYIWLSLFILLQFMVRPIKSLMPSHNKAIFFSPKSSLFSPSFQIILQVSCGFICGIVASMTLRRPIVGFLVNNELRRF